MLPQNTTRVSFIQRLRDPRDAGSWAEFHKRYGELLYSYALRQGASHDIAEDVVQDVEMALYKAVGGFRHYARKGCFRTYLRTAVVHAMGRKAAKRAREEAILDPHTLEAVATEEVHDECWEREQHLHCVRWAMRQIAKEFEPTTLEAFRIHVLGEKSVADTAMQLGISKESVYQAKSRVLKRLRERVGALRLNDDF